MKDGDDPPRTETIWKRGAAFTLSFEEESTALRSAAAWIRDNCDARSRPLIMTDSQSICKSLLGYGPSTDLLRCNLTACSDTICMQWVPGNSGIPVNEEANRAVNEARLLNEICQPVSFRGISPVIKKSRSKTALVTLQKNTLRRYILNTVD